MKVIEGDVISTVDGRYGTVREVKGDTLTVESLPVLSITEDDVEVDAGEVFFVRQAEVTGIR